MVSDRLGNSGNKLKIWNNSIPSRETVKTVTVCDSCQYHSDYVTLQFVCFNNQWVTDVLTLDKRPLTCDQTTRFAAQSDMAEVQEVVIDCVALFYEEGKGGGGWVWKLSEEKQV